MRIKAHTHLGDEGLAFVIYSAMRNVGLEDFAVLVQNDDLAVLVAGDEEAVLERLNVFRVQASRVEGIVAALVLEICGAVALGRGVVAACVARRVMRLSYAALRFAPGSCCIASGKLVADSPYLFDWADFHCAKGGLVPLPVAYFPYTSRASA
jgi:hypothetical protein